MIYADIDAEVAIVSFAEVERVLSDELMRKIILTLSELLSAPYSIGFCLPYNQGPLFYVHGIGYGRPTPKTASEREIQDRFCRWGHTGIPEKVYLRGVIREVYKMNLLCESQANFKFSGKTFFECVLAGEVEGTIERIAPNRVLWTVSDSDIPKATEKCEKAGFLFDQIDTLPPLENPDPEFVKFLNERKERQKESKLAKFLNSLPRSYE